MSRPFEQNLARWFHERVPDLDPQAGDRYAAEFPDESTAKNVCSDILDPEILDEVDLDCTMREVEYEGVTQNLPTIDVEGTLMYVVLVRRSGDEVSERYEVSRSYATTIRNVLAENGGPDSDVSLFMIYETGVGIETLDTTHNLFDADGQLPLTDFQQRTRENYGPLDEHGAPSRAIVSVIDEELEFPDDPMEDLSPLRTFCAIYDACAQADGDRLPGLIPDVGTYLTETAFGDEWFDKTESEEELKSQVRQLLRRNKQHAERIKEARRVSKDTEAELGAYYTDEFINAVLETSDWTTITRSQAADGELSAEETETTDDELGSGGSGPTSPSPDRDPEFKAIEVDSEQVHVYGSSGETADDRSIVATVPEGSFEATISYDLNVSGEPSSFTNESGEEIEGKTIDDREITISLSGLNPEAPHYYSLKVYIGHKTKRGTPKNQFDFALVPEWFFNSIGDDTYGVDVAKEALIVRTDNPITLDQPGGDTDGNRVVKEITEETQSVVLSNSLLLRPSVPPKVERLRCQVSAPEDAPVPVNIDFLSEREEPSQGEIQLPLSFAAIATPNHWADDDLLVSSTVVADLTTGEFHSPNRGLIEVPDMDRQCLQIEEALIEDGTIAPRETDQADVGTGVPQSRALDRVAPDLVDAYTRLFKHFDDRDEVPSTDPWDAETQELVDDLLQTYVDSVDSIEPGSASPSFDPYRRIGTIRSTSTESVWLTPFHPLMLAYGLRVSRWRNKLVAEGQTAGFRFSRFQSLFNPVGLKPYRWKKNGAGGEIFSGHKIRNNYLWAGYTPIGGPGSETPDYMSDVVGDKLEAFTKAFELLFRLHPEREVHINLINMGDLGAVIEGLYDFFEFVTHYPELNLPQINLHIYGDESEGRTLERFFASDSADSPLRDRLSNRSQSDEIIDHLDRQVTYIHADKQFNEETRRPAHLTMFRGILRERPGTMEAETFPKATRMDGLLPWDQIKVETNAGEIVSRSGAAFDPDSESLIDRVGAAVNSLEASLRDNEFTTGRALSKSITASNQTDLPNIWEQSMWVLHVEPKVDLDFYIQSTSRLTGPSQDTLMIHYSDQYDAASPGFDVITTTNKRDPYLQALQQVLNETPGLDEIDPESVLTRLVAIDGELALDIQQADDNTTMELLGLVGGLAVSAELLAGELPEYEWIPLSLNEFARHDSRYRGDTEGLLQYFGDGKASDDLCFIGIPRDQPTEDLSLKLWIVETKGGSAGINKGVEQVKGARDNLTDLFNPDEPYADTPILRSEFGDVITRIANRLHHYGVIEEDRKENVDQYSDRLADGDYRIDLLKDERGRIGEVIRIRRDIALPKQDVRDGVRVIELPPKVLRLINERPTGENEIHSDLDTTALSFNSAEIAVSDDSGTTEAEYPDGAEGEVSSGGDGAESTQQEPNEASRATSAKSSADEEVGPEPAEQLEGDDSDDQPDDGEAAEKDEIKSRDSEKTESESSQTEAQQPDTEDVGSPQDIDYSWDSDDFVALTEDLTASPETNLEIDLSRLTNDLKSQFESLGIDVHQPNPAEISIGPRKIGVNVRPKSGQKIESVLNSLDSISVFIQASGTITGVPNPSEGAIRLEIPHGEPRDIYLREGLEALHDELLKPLHIPLGVNTENEHIAIDLLDEYHMLVGGATGSGKSNFLGACICSLAVSQSPSRVRLSLLDPKGIDFGRFESFPHVDTYLDTASGCVDYLRELIDTELEDRRQLLQDRGVASVQEYNQLAASSEFDPIPYRVIVIDEFADLIMSLSDNKEEFENSVGRLAQIGRALGYSILLATQRPDADIVSGNIKTNFNCRVSFELPSNTDSRVILDQPGAEDLEGAGDMIALTSDGEEYHLQAYRLRPEDAVTIRERLTSD